MNVTHKGKKKQKGKVVSCKPFYSVRRKQVTTFSSFQPYRGRRLYAQNICFFSSGLDKITEKAQVSEDGTMVAVPHSDSPQATADCGAAAGGSDTESNSERDHEVTAPHHWCSRHVFHFLLLKWFIPSSGVSGGVRGNEESTVQCVVISSLEPQSRLGTEKLFLSNSVSSIKLINEFWSKTHRFSVNTRWYLYKCGTNLL